MMRLGERIKEKRKELNITQIELADKMGVTRQTVSRWEAGTVLPDVEKVTQLAELLGVSCDELLMEDVPDQTKTATRQQPVITRLLSALVGRKVQLSFYDEESDSDLALVPCTIVAFEGGWMKAEVETKKEHFQKLIPVASVLSVEILE